MTESKSIGVFPLGALICSANLKLTQPLAIKVYWLATNTCIHRIIKPIIRQELEYWTKVTN